MPTSSMHSHSGEDAAPLGAADTLEQKAADLARKENRTQITDKDREDALAQMRSTSPPANVSDKET